MDANATTQQTRLPRWRFELLKCDRDVLARGIELSKNLMRIAEAWCQRVKGNVAKELLMECTQLLRHLSALRVELCARDYPFDRGLALSFHGLVIFARSRGSKPCRSKARIIALIADAGPER
jgi:hypothetical protein